MPVDARPAAGERLPRLRRSACTGRCRRRKRSRLQCRSLSRRTRGRLRTAPRAAVNVRSPQSRPAVDDPTAATLIAPSPAADGPGLARLRARPPARTTRCFDERRRQSAPHWHVFLQSLEELGLPQLTRRWAEARHLIRENGVTYNVYGDPRGMDRPWQLDPIPLLIAAGRGDALADGLIQRGRLLEAILADLYGPQQTLARGTAAARARLRQSRLPAALPRRAAAAAAATCISTPPTSAASDDGSFWVLGDRTQSPSGAGYALENRLVLSRMLPEAFRDCRVQRLALFFRTLRDTLRGLAPHNRDNPRIVLLTPGPYNETYFEHAYLARYLGYTLVEGGDLTVRDNRVYLKLLGGLQPVDVILRRLDDDFCDPLELRGDSFLGVPGLVQAVRAATWRSPTPWAAACWRRRRCWPSCRSCAATCSARSCACRRSPTWWCGDAAALRPRPRPPRRAGRQAGVARRAVRAGLRRRADRASNGRAGASASAPGRATYVGQEQLPLSTTPVLVGDRLAAAPPGAARVPGRRRRFVRRDAGRPDAGQRLGRHHGRLDAARRRQQGHLGPVRRAGQHVQPAAARRRCRSS